MRTAIVGFLLALGLGTTSCFESSTPNESGTDSCQDGLEGCPCLEGECIGDLMCLSMLCVDPNAGTGTSTATSTTTPPTTMGPVDTGSVDTGSVDTGSVDTGSVDTGFTTGPVDTGSVDTGPPPGDECDPLLQDCNNQEVCIPHEDGFACFQTDGSDVFGDPCVQTSCDVGLLCWANPFDSCPAAECCTAFCDMDFPDCPMGLECASYYEPGMEPPGFESVGICVQ